MPLDPSIASGGTPVQIENPMTRLASLLQMQKYTDDSALSQAKLQESQRGVGEQTAMAKLLSGDGFDITKPDQQRQLLAVAPTKGVELLDKYSQSNERATQGIEKRAKAVQEFAGISRDLATKVITQPTIENALAALDQAAYYHKFIGLGDLNTSQERASLAANPSPENIKQWASGHAQIAKDLLPKNVEFSAGDRHINQSIDPVTGLPTQTGSTVIGQSADSKATTGLGYSRLNEEKRHNGVTESNAAGTLELQRQLQAGGGKPSADYLKQAEAYQNMDDALTGYKKVLNGFSAVDMINPSKRAEMGTAYSNAMLQAKEIYKLGVLNGGDERILNSILNNPADFSTSLIDKKALLKQAEDLQAIIKRGNGTLARVNKQTEMPLPSANGAPAPASKTIVQTGTLNGKKVVKYSDGTVDYAN